MSDLLGDLLVDLLIHLGVDNLIGHVRTLLHHLMLVVALIMLLRSRSEVNSQVLVRIHLRFFHSFLLGRLLLRLDVSRLAFALSLHLRNSLLVLLRRSLGLDLLLHLVDIILSLHVLLHLSVHLLHHCHHLLVFILRSLCNNLHGAIFVVNSTFTRLLQVMFGAANIRRLLLNRALTACQQNLFSLLNFALDCLRLLAEFFFDLFGNGLNDFFHKFLGQHFLWLNCLGHHFLNLSLLL